MQVLPFVLTATLVAIGVRACAAEAAVQAEVSSALELRAAVARLKGTVGGAIYLRPGTYAIREPLVVEATSNVSIHGAGRERTVLRREGDGHALIFRGPCNNCSVRNLRIVGDPAATSGSGIVFSDTDWSGLSTIDSCTIEGFADSGVCFAGRFATPQSSNTVSRCTLTNNRQAQIRSESNNDFYFLANRLSIDTRAARGAYGIAMRCSSAGFIADNTIRRCRVGVKLGKSCSMNRIERNTFEDCAESAIDSGMDAPADYDVTRVPRDQLYVGWDWSIDHPVRMNTEPLICWNRIRVRRSNPEFVALDARSTVFATFYGNTVEADHPIGSVVRAGRNCMTWLVAGNRLSGVARKGYALDAVADLRCGPEAVSPVACPSPSRPLGPSGLSDRLLKAAAGRDVSGRGWYRRVASVEELARAAAELPAAGGTIYVTAGQYRLAAPLVFESRRNVTLIGSGLASCLRGAEGADALVFRGDCRNCYVGNLTVTPDRAIPGRPVEQATGSGIVVQGRGSDIAVEYCEIDNWPVSCIRVEGEPDHPIRNVRILSNWIVFGRQAQLYMRGCAGFTVSCNQFGYTFPDKSPTGALLEHCSDGVYELNCHWGNRNGVQFAQGCESVCLWNNRSEQSKESGLLLGSPGAGAPNRSFTIVGNTFHTNPELDPGTCSNVTAMNTSDVRFVANQVYTWWAPRRSRNGVELDARCRGWAFDGNYVRDYNDSAVRCETAGAHVFRLNRFDGPGG